MFFGRSSNIFRAKPPIRKPAPPLLDKLATPQKNTLCSFHFARARFFLLLMKRVFFCGVLPPSIQAGGGTGLNLISKRKSGIPPKPPFRFFFSQTSSKKHRQNSGFKFPPKIWSARSAVCSAFPPQNPDSARIRPAESILIVWILLEIVSNFVQQTPPVRELQSRADRLASLGG